jgi:hypothetical protein
MTSEKTLYVDRSPWPRWADVLLASLTALISYAILTGWTSPPARVPQRGVAVAALMLSMGAVKLLVGGLTVLVREHGLLVHLGSLPVLRRAVPYSEIESLRAVRYHPLRDFGGWGIRGRGARKAWTARGDRAVELKLAGGRELLVGSDYPQRLEGWIRAAMAVASELAE